MTSTIEDRNSELIADIQNLQSVETGLFQSLETGITNKSLTQDQQNSLVDQINKIANMRESLYKSLDSTQQYYNGTVSSVGGIIGHQINALDVVENQMNESKKRLKAIQQEKDNKLRLVEINTYYGEKYETHTGIMKTIVFFCIPIIILAILANANILPHSVYVLLFIIIVVAALVVILRKILEALSHDNMNYQEYVWGSSPPTKPYVETGNSAGVDPWKGLGLTCMAQECCDTGFTYVPSPTNKCIANASLPTGVAPYSQNQSQSVASSTPKIAAAPVSNGQSVASVYQSLANL
jgi:hypothetical protein